MKRNAQKRLMAQAMTKQAGIGDVALEAADIGSYFIPGVGSARMGYNAYNDFSNGNYWSGTGNLIGAGLGLLPGGSSAAGLLRGGIKGLGIGAKYLGVGSKYLGGAMKGTKAFSGTQGLLSSVGRSATGFSNKLLKPIGTPPMSGLINRAERWDTGVKNFTSKANDRLVGALGGPRGRLGGPVNNAFAHLSSSPNLMTGLSLGSSAAGGLGQWYSDSKAQEAQANQGMVQHAMNFMRSGQHGFVNPMYARPGQ